MQRVIPNHVAIIMDGNGRWAKKKGLPRNFGHERGIRAVEEVSEHAHQVGVKVLSLFAFSTENWSRPREEIEYLLSYLKKYLVKEKER